MSEHTAQSLYEDVKRLLASAKDDYENRRWDNHSYYVKKFNELLNRAKNLGMGSDLLVIKEADADEEIPTSWSSGTPYHPQMVQSAGSKTRKLREVIDATDKLLDEISLDVSGGFSRTDTKNRALAQLQQLIQRINLLKKRPPHSNAFHKWKRDAEVAIENIFQPGSRHLEDLRSVSYYPISVYSLGVPGPAPTNEELRTAYVEGLKRARFVLKSMIDEIKTYWNRDFEVFKSRSTEVTANRFEALESVTTLLFEKPRLLNSRYRILRSVIATKFSQTFLAEDDYSPSKRKCFIKEFAYSSSDPKSDGEMISRFIREASVLERLGEIDQIPTLFAYFSENGKFYLVQEYITGDNLAAKIANSGPFSESKVTEIVKSVLAVLMRVHGKGVIHRDIKPENIVLREEDDKPFLVDFGIIKEITKTIVDTFANSSVSIVAGTPGYMSAEQAAGRPIFASDLYALGLTAIFMLTGKRPNELNDPLTGEICWREHAVSISQALAAVLDKAIKSDPRDRFAGAAEMLAAFESSNKRPRV
jgi:Serine/threonine protein kinase